MNTSHTNPQNDPGAELRRTAVVEMLKGIKETILLLHSMALCERETVARAPPPAGWAASRCPNPPDRARYLTDALPAPYRYLTEPEHAFRPMFIRVLTDLTDL